MGSVVTYWSGCSKSAADQSELIAYIEELAIRSEARWRRGMDHGSALLKASPVQSETLPKESLQVAALPYVIRFDHELTGRILVGDSMLLLDQLSESMQQSAQLIPTSDAWLNEASVATCAISSRGSEQRFAIVVPRFRLHGIAFRLYDPRQLYSDQDWMSFAFVQSSEFAELDGQMVQAFSREQCRTLGGGWFQNAEWALETPTIRLRDYLEEWFDLLMVWIKIFFVPELDYWRNEVLNRFHEIKSSIDRLMEANDRETAKQAVFEYILESFESEVNAWEAEIAKM